MLHLTLSILESWIWESANIIRDSIDASNFKNNIFGLLFLKRSSVLFKKGVEPSIKCNRLTRANT
ncbi:type I restriction-modification system subunit M N-terminal domain-containing protein [Mariniflexile fucanivorans]|uniref:type I restriction-modification system subunit M N-terminal domain-containing protein n=1 Tax=Mariniflexile fucanivorans TaxID=264023 RepID=UPI001045F1CE